MVMTYFESLNFFCKNKLYEKMDVQLVPKNENKLRTIRGSNKYFIVRTLSYKDCKIKQ